MGGGEGAQEVMFNRNINSDGRRDDSPKLGVRIADTAPGTQWGLSGGWSLALA